MEGYRVSLDERYVVAYHHCRRCARSIRVLRSSGPMDSATTGFSGPLFYAIFRSMAHHFRRFRKMVSSRSWSLTASYSTGPQIRNRWRALAPEETLRELQSSVWTPAATPAHKTVQSLGPVPLHPCSYGHFVAQRQGQSSTIREPRINLALIRSRGRKNGVGDFR